MKKRYLLFSVLGVVLITAGLVALRLLSAQAPSEKEPQQNVKAFTVYDSAGQQLFSSTKRAEIYDAQCWAYLEIVLNETAQLVAEAEGCTAAEAKDLLVTQGYQIHTAFDPAAFQVMQQVASEWKDTANTAYALTDLHGSLLAVTSTDTQDKQINHALQRRSPYSAFKALSVYTPALEKGLIHWSSLYQDAPLKQLKTDSGQLQDWPANATNTYSRENVPVYEALRTSLNTVAVRCLLDVGIPEAISFLQTGFGIALQEEEYVVKTYGEEEVMGNIALGYLETGITPVEMTGYYQIFGTGGLYAAPQTVNSILREDGSALYTRSVTQEQVVSAATADTMNKLLQGVVAAGGTGEWAYCEDVAIAGKTGTGDNYADNWFVGVTPGYSLGVWHGQSDSNQAALMFAQIIRKLYQAQPNANRKFVTHQNLYQLAWCTRSGKALSSKCTLIQTGYFQSKDALPVCDVCNKD